MAEHSDRNHRQEAYAALIVLAQAIGEGEAESATGSAIAEMLPLILGVLAAIVVGLLVLRAVKTAKSLSSYGEGLPRQDRQAIKRFEDAKNYVGAGDLLHERKRYEEAIELYTKGEDFLRVAESYEALGNTNQAVQAYKRAGAKTQAASLLAKRNQYAAAAELYEEAGEDVKAAEYYAQGKQYAKAAGIYVKQRRFLDAARAFEGLGDRGKAAKAYKAYFEEELGVARGDMDQLPEEAIEAAHKAARYLVKANRAEDAGDLLRRGGLLKDAADAYQRGGALEKAAEIYVEVDRPMQAAKLYDAAGNREKAFLYRGEALLKKGDTKKAALDFARAGEHVRAAELLVAGGDHAEAAQMWAQAGDFMAAAEMYISAGDERSAARAYEEGGDYVAAGNIYQRLGDAKSEIRVCKSANNYYRVGEILLAHQKEAEALAAFQQVNGIDAKYADACEKQGDLLAKMGKDGLAFVKYRDAAEGQKPTTANVDLYYKLALSAEKANDLETAKQNYERVVSVSFDFRDASDRLANLRKAALAPAQTSQPTSQGGFVGNVGIGRYEIIKEIARGGMGIVYKARDTVLDRVVAYKILSSELKSNKTAVKYFLREARAAAKMTHPNIVTVYDAGEQDGEYYMAMEYVEGQTLKSLVTKQGPFPEKLIAYAFVHACHGLAFAHGQGLVHRDVKPGNIMLTRDRVLKIMDFGLAKFVSEVHAQHTRAIGTPYYMSPEQVVGRELDGRSDIYSLGISMFECATGSVPFAKGDLPYHHLHTPPPYARDLNPNLSTGISDIIHKCMQKSPDDRYSDVAALEAAVKAL